MMMMLFIIVCLLQNSNFVNLTLNVFYLFLFIFYFFSLLCLCLAYSIFMFMPCELYIWLLVWLVYTRLLLLHNRLESFLIRQMSPEEYQTCLLLLPYIDCLYPNWQEKTCHILKLYLFSLTHTHVVSLTSWSSCVYV